MSGSRSGSKLFSLSFAAAALLALVGPACKKAVPEAPPATAQVAPPLEVKADGKWLYTYADEAGRFVTTDDAKKVPEAARKVVRVLDPAAQTPSPTGAVYVIDLAELEKKGKLLARSLSREAFETGALSQLGPGESSPYPGGPSAEAPAAGADPGAAPPAGAPATDPGGAPVVTLYGASWCGACKQAREYLRSRRIPFADRDIERDKGAARELQEKARRLGIGADRIPVLDVRGRLLVGFDRARLEALLGEAT